MKARLLLLSSTLCLSSAFLGCSREAELRPLDPPAVEGSMAPRLWMGAKGVHLSWLEPTAAAVDPRTVKLWRMRMATLAGRSWSPAQTVVESASFFRNWADTPGVAETAEGGMMAHWLERLGEGSYAYGVMTARAGAAGASFASPEFLHEDRSPTEHGFVSWLPEGDGLRAFWLDGRAMAASEGEEAVGSMQLRTATIGADGRISPSVLVDDRVCECCPTDAALGSAGALVVYRDRSEDEVRDIELRRRTAEGWSEPVLVAADGWKIPGCPVNGPAVAARGEEVLVLYFTGAQERPRVQLAVSRDGGRSFAPPEPIDLEQPLGRVDLALASDGTAWMSWIEKTDDGGRLQLRCRTPAGQLAAPLSLALNSGERSAGVPRILVEGERLLVAWVDDLKPSQVKVAEYPAACRPREG